MRGSVFTLLLIFIVFLSCREEDDGVFPTILISSPQENTQFNVLDIIAVKASITDNEKIERVTISLQQLTTGRAVLSTIELSPGGSSYQLDQSFPISDSLLESGEYSLRIDAFDGENTSSAFSTITIQGINRRSLGLVAALDRSTSVDMVQLDANQNQAVLYSSSSVGEIAVNSFKQQLWFSMPGQEKIGTVDLIQSVLVFEEFPNSNGQSDQILDVELLGDRFYVATARNTVQAFNSRFQDVFTHLSPQGSIVRRIHPLDSRVMLQESDLQGNNQSLLYMFNNGAVDTRSSDQSDIIGFGARSSAPNSAFMFINVGNNFQVREMNLQSGLSSFLIEKGNLNPSSLLQISEYQYLLISNDQVHQYNISTNFLRLYRSNLVDPKVAYDEVGDVVYIASGNNLYAYSYQQAQLLFSSSFAFPIIDIAVRYNK